MDSICTERGWNVLRLNGEVTREHASGVYLQVQRLLDKGRVNILLDLEGATYLDSAALGVLVRAYKDARSRGGEVALTHVPADVQALLEYTRLDTILRRTSAQVRPDDPEPWEAA